MPINYLAGIPILYKCDEENCENEIIAADFTKEWTIVKNVQTKKICVICPQCSENILTLKKASEKITSHNPLLH